MYVYIYIHTHTHTHTHTYIYIYIYIRGLIHNFTDTRCKNRKTRHKAYRPPSPSKYFPPACRHRSHRLLHFWNASWNVRMSSTPCHSAWISSIVSNRRPFSFNFSFGNRKKSQGAKSGEYVEWGITAILFFARNWWVRTEV